MHGARDPGAPDRSRPGEVLWLACGRGGAIVNIASIGGKIAVPHMLPYSASKFALVGFSNPVAV